MIVFSPALLHVSLVLACCHPLCPRLFVCTLLSLHPEINQYNPRGQCYSNFVIIILTLSLVNDLMYY